MIIESIELNNFMCYYDRTQFDFTEGMNVIIGDNGYGKSKLYDAFYWVMFDKCFDTNLKEWMPTKHLGRSIISDKAVHEAQDGAVKASVKITFKNLDKDSAYSIERILTARKSDDEVIVDSESEEIVIFKQLSYLEGKEITDPVEIESIKKTKILPDNIRPYMWFQGEQVESIIDFGESRSLTQAINVLSNITRFDSISQLAASWKKASSEEYQRKVRALSKDKDKSDALELERNRILEKIENLEKDELKQNDNLGNAEAETERLLNQLEDAGKIRDLEARQKLIGESMERATSDEKQERIDLHKKLFTHQWVLKGTEGLFKKYSEKFATYERNKLQKLAEEQIRLKVENQIKEELQTRLPINVPEAHHVEEMIRQKVCLVCNTPAPEGSEAYNSIVQLLERSTDSPEETENTELTKHDFSRDFQKLSQNGYSLEQVVKRVDSDIKKTFRHLKKIEKRRKASSEDWSKITAEIESIMTDSALDSSKANNILNEWQAKNDYAKKFGKDLTQTKLFLERNQQELKAIDKKLGDLVVGEIPAFLEEKKQVLEEFDQVAQSTRARVFKTLVKRLETEANKHYHEMMQGNLGTRGIIKLVESTTGNYMPRLVDENDRPLMQLNTGNIILIKLATIMAIISARQGSRDTDLYTLITDAPMSVFGEDYTIGFCKAVSKVYRQSIIMSKEFYKNKELREELLKNSEIKRGKIYMITPSIPEKERSNRNSLETKVKALN